MTFLEKYNFVKAVAHTFRIPYYEVISNPNNIEHCTHIPKMVY